MIELNYEDGILNRGNTYRLKLLMTKAKEGGEYTIGFIGGSITQGSVASVPERCYAYNVYRWWVANFPKATFNFVNAGIGATDSQFGSSRVYDDLLSYNPDFAITEYSVNDENNEHFLETYEGLIRRIYDYKTKPALITMNNICYDSGINAEDQHVKLAKYYKLPAIGIRPTLYRAIKDGKIEASEITPDNLHPNDLGHLLVAAHIIFFLDKIFNEMSEKVNDDEKEVMLTKPLTVNSYEHSTRFNNNNIKPELNGFTADLSTQQGVWDCFKNGWTAGTTGDSIIFKVAGTNISVQYKKAYLHPAPIARLTLDGDSENSIILDANFDETWGDKLFLTTVAEHIEDTEHEVKIELIETHDDDTAPFYLAALLVSGKDI